jgi:hypothetical protein
MYDLKVRVISKDFRALMANPGILNPFRYGAVAISLWSHKLLRWLVPYFLLTLFASNTFLRHVPFYRVALLLQLIFYGTALVGLCRRSHALPFPFSIPMSFCIVNFAALIGIAKSMIGRKSGRWKPVRKQSPAV